MNETALLILLIVLVCVCLLLLVLLFLRKTPAGSADPSVKDALRRLEEKTDE